MEEYIRINNNINHNNKIVLYRGVDAKTGYLVINDKNGEEPTAQLDIIGNIRIRDLENTELLKTKNPADLKPVVSDEEGNIFRLPSGEKSQSPIIRSKQLNHGESLEIKNIFSEWDLDFNDGRHLVEIKLLFHKGMENSSFVNIN